jgi:hypothetical protein
MDPREGGIALSQQIRPKGPFAHRFLIGLFTVGLAVLLYWLLGFVLKDIGTWPGPDYAVLEAQRLDPKLVDQETALQEQLGAVDRRIADKTVQQQLLRDSTENSQRTMHQLLEFQRLNLQKDVKPTAEEQQALAESERLFLGNQRQYQQLNEELVALNGERRDLQASQKELQRRLEQLRKPIRAEYTQLARRHDLKLGAFKLVFVLPLLVMAAVLFYRKRCSHYAPMIYAFGASVLLHAGLVMHEYFPARYFKYVLILVSLAIVARILVYLLRMTVQPKRDWLLRQYREAYEVFMCPMCSYPIRRGPMRYGFWTRRSIKKMALSTALPAEDEEPYICPACSTQLYEKCDQCGAVRMSLLPTCQSCGNSKSLDAPGL